MCQGTPAIIKGLNEGPAETPQTSQLYVIEGFKRSCQLRAPLKLLEHHSCMLLRDLRRALNLGPPHAERIQSLLTAEVHTEKSFRNLIKPGLIAGFVH